MFRDILFAGKIHPFRQSGIIAQDAAECTDPVLAILRQTLVPFGLGSRTSCGPVLSCPNAFLLNDGSLRFRCNARKLLRVESMQVGKRLRVDLLESSLLFRLVLLAGALRPAASVGRLGPGCFEARFGNIRSLLKPIARGFGLDFDAIEIAERSCKALSLLQSPVDFTFLPTQTFDPFALQIRQGLLTLPVVAAQCIQTVACSTAGRRIGNCPNLAFDIRGLRRRLPCLFRMIASFPLEPVPLCLFLSCALLGSLGRVLVAKPRQAPALHLRFPGLVVLASPSRTIRACMGLTLVLARTISTRTGLALIGRDPLGERFDLASDLQHPRFSPLHPAPCLVETAAAESFPPRFEVSMRGPQMFDSVLRRADRFCDPGQAVLDPAQQLSSRLTVVAGGLVDGQDESIIRRAPGDIGGDRNNHRSAQGREGLQYFSRALQGIPIGHRDTHEASGVALGELADLPRRTEDLGEIDGVRLAVPDAGFKEPFGDSTNILVDGSEPGDLQGLAVGLQYLLPPLGIAQHGDAPALGLRQHAGNAVCIRIDLTLAGHVSEREELINSSTLVRVPVRIAVFVKVLMKKRMMAVVAVRNRVCAVLQTAVGAVVCVHRRGGVHSLRAGEASGGSFA